MSAASQELVRCPWASNEFNTKYHDEEWGVPVHDDRLWFEFLILEGAQAGLSWDIDGKKVRELLRDPGIVRNRLKLASTVTNAQAFLRVQKEFGSFDKFIWQFVGGAPVQNRWKLQKEVPAKSALSIALSKDLLKRGFRFVGPTICYAFMQATGLVNDHLVSCHRFRQLQ
ncbi:MAG: DNA-3-methyladenine glycosylase I [Candidatus Acidiferrum sp.]